MTTTSSEHSLPPRSDVPAADTWDLSSLFPSDAEWEAALAVWEAGISGFARFVGTLGASPEALAACLDHDLEFDRSGDRLGTYAHLRASEDQGAPQPQRMVGRFQHVATRAAETSSFMLPEIMAIPPESLDAWLCLPVLAPHRIGLERIVRRRPHVLSQREEKLLAMQGTFAGTAAKVFRQLTDADMKFGNVVNGSGRNTELSNATFSTFLLDPDRGVRRTAFHQFYDQYQAHANTLAATLSGSVERDVYSAKVRNHSSAVEAALFADNVPLTVYDQLIAAVRSHLPTIHRYYDLRRRLLGLDDIHHYDCYVPLVQDVPQRHTWDEAVDLVVESLRPLGPDYCRRLGAGLRGRWCDRYPNAGKQSGAFSSGTYDSDPYILMNFQDEAIEHVFTLAHEAGHSMHTRLSADAQPYQLAGYTIFVAEVASTFNEQFLARHLLERAKSPRERAHILSREIDGIRSTIVRQTMFAEFERRTHASAEAGEPLTLERLRGIYRELLDAYFGPGFVIDGQLELECLRIPHYYSAFYVYKYATGLAAAVALSEKVAGGGKAELNAYLDFLRGGCSRWPLELLRDAGVDLEQPEPVATALERFGRLVDELETTLGG
ncbi:MAG: oligoendopeptidase F [Planctomycetota bacterium]|nr:MAG: oligoendopeptidase F [Planctomycetota bacterium]